MLQHFATKIGKVLQELSLLPQRKAFPLFGHLWHLAGAVQRESADSKQSLFQELFVCNVLGQMCPNAHYVGRKKVVMFTTYVQPGKKNFL